MKYNLIIKEKRKKIYFFIILKYFLNSISSFDFADFQLLQFLKNISILDKLLSINFTQVCIFMDIIANCKRNFYIFFKLKKNYNYIEKSNIPNLLQLCLFYEKNINFVVYKYKICIFNILIFFYLLFKKLYYSLNLFKKKKIFFNKKLKIFIKNFIDYLFLQKGTVEKFVKRHIRIYIFLITKILTNFDYNITNLYILKSIISKNILHCYIQKVLKEEIIKYYFISTNYKKYKDVKK
jgi:hypothetical protein